MEYILCFVDILLLYIFIIYKYYFLLSCFRLLGMLLNNLKYKSKCFIFINFNFIVVLYWCVKSEYFCIILGLFKIVK